jgi:F-type H+-transporting ATPase subunit epsilon
VSGTAASSAGALTLRVVTPEGAVFDGPVETVVVPGHDGETAFLKGHAPFVGLLGTGELRFQTAGGASAHYFLGGGVVQVLGDVVTVLAEAVTVATALDAGKAQAEIDAALRLPGATDDEIAARAKALDAGRAKLRLAGASRRAPAAH